MAPDLAVLGASQLTYTLDLPTVAAGFGPQGEMPVQEPHISRIGLADHLESRFFEVIKHFFENATHRWNAMHIIEWVDEMNIARYQVRQPGKPLSRHAFEETDIGFHASLVRAHGRTNPRVIRK